MNSLFKRTLNLTKTNIALILAVFFILFFSACDDSDESLDKGTCEVNVSGYVVKSYHGTAIFENIPSISGSKIFFLHLKDINLANGEYRYVEFSGSMPDIGTYNLINLESEEVHKGDLLGRYNDSESYGSFKSTSGEIVITYASDIELKGRFDFSAYEHVPNDNGEFQRVEVRIKGEFYAEEGYTGIILN